MTPADPPRVREAPASDVAFVGLAQRAGAILQRMEQCSPPLITSQKQSAAGATLTAVEDISEAPASGGGAARRDAAAYQGVHSARDPPVPPHLARAKYALPAPTRATYDMVLKAYAKEHGPRRVAELAEDVVWSMATRAATRQRRRRTRPARTSDHGEGEEDGVDSGDGDARQPLPWPSREHWHSVLKCWSRSADPNRAYHAYAFLLAWREWHELCLQHDKDLRDVPGTAEDPHPPPSVDSLSLVLESCWAEFEGEFNGDAAKFLRAREMGSGVAARIWKERKRWWDGADAPDAALYHGLLRALCQAPALPAGSSGAPELLNVARVFARCQEDGRATPEILDMVRAAMTESQFARLTTSLEKDGERAGKYAE